jgi:hypothetical protein
MRWHVIKKVSYKEHSAWTFYKQDRTKIEKKNERDQFKEIYLENLKIKINIFRETINIFNYKKILKLKGLI